MPITDQQFAQEFTSHVMAGSSARHEAEVSFGNYDTMILKVCYSSTDKLLKAINFLEENNYTDGAFAGTTFLIRDGVERVARDSINAHTQLPDSGVWELNIRMRPIQRELVNGGESEFIRAAMRRMLKSASFFPRLPDGKETDMLCTFANSAMANLFTGLFRKANELGMFGNTHPVNITQGVSNVRIHGSDIFKNLGEQWGVREATMLWRELERKGAKPHSFGALTGGAGITSILAQIEEAKKNARAPEGRGR